MDEWLAKNSPDERSPLIKSETVTFADKTGRKYFYGNLPDSSVGQRVNVYIPIKDKIYAFVVYPFDLNPETYYQDLDKLIGSFQVN